MKKNLLASSALIAVGALASNGAFAESKPIQIQVGGYYEQWVGIIVQDSDADTSGTPTRYADSVDVQEDGEIFFKGSMTADNGLTFGVNVQLEAATSSDQIDESYLFVRGSFGEIVLGSENGPAYAMHYGTDIDKGYGLEEGDTSFYWFSGGATNQLNTSRLASIDNDSQKMRWISPRFSGVQLGLSYAPEGRQDTDGRVPNESANGNGVYEDIIAGAINYDQKFGETRVRLSAGGQFVGDANGKVSGGADEVWATALGLRIGSGGFEGTLAWGHHNGVAAGGNAAKSMDTITAGVAYTSGPLGVSLTGAYGFTDSGSTTTPDAKQMVIQLGAGYKVGPGVSLNGTVAYVNSDDVQSGGGGYTGFGVVGGVKLSF